MKKGMEKKLDIIQTAENLFCRFGYENTSIQQILDALHTSKGSFYHHFESKEKLLEEICIRRSHTITGQIVANTENISDPVEALNALLSGLIPLNGEKLGFLLMLLPVFSLPEGWSVQRVYCRELSLRLDEPLQKTLESGRETGAFAPLNIPRTAHIVLSLTNSLWCEICDMIILSEKQGEICDPSELLRMADAYRSSVERILSAPFGSIRLVSIQDIKNLSEQIHAHWKK